MIKKKKKLFTLALLASTLTLSTTSLLGGFSSFTWKDIERCYELGGRWDFGRMICVYDNNN